MSTWDYFWFEKTYLHGLLPQFREKRTLIDLTRYTIDSFLEHHLTWWSFPTQYQSKSMSDWMYDGDFTDFVLRGLNE